MATIYRCTNPRCRAIITHHVCGECGAQAKAISDVHLGALGLDVYASLEIDRPSLLDTYLLIKKPSGQVRVSLKSIDFL